MAKAVLKKIPGGLGVMMAAQGLTKTGRRRKAKDSDYKLSRLEITPADNGYLVTTFHEPKSGAGDVAAYREPKKSVYKDRAAMVQGIASHLGGGGDSESE